MFACNRLNLSALAACCLLAMSACGTSSSTTGNNAPPPGGEPAKIDGYGVGNRAFEIEGNAIADGTAIQLSKYKGKVVLLDFWATWCVPCVAAIPHEKELVARFRDRPFALIGISMDRTAEDLRKFLGKSPLSWPNIFDEGQRISRQWNVEYIPTFVLIDAEGFIIGRWDSADPEIDKAIEKELAAMEKRK